MTLPGSRIFHVLVGLCSVLTLASCTTGDSDGDIQGTWLYVSYVEGGEIIEVLVDVNAASQPYLVIDGDQINGDSGRNGFGGDFQYENGELRADEVSSEAALCMPETLMGSERAFHEVISGGAALAVSVEGDTMRWRRGGAVLKFTRTDQPPPEPTIPPQTSFGPLDCGNDVVVTEDVPSERTTAEEVAFQVDHRVTDVSVEDDLGHHATGYDSEGDVLVVVSFQDVDPFPYRVYTCP